MTLTRSGLNPAIVSMSSTGCNPVTLGEYSDMSSPMSTPSPASMASNDAGITAPEES